MMLLKHAADMKILKLMTNARKASKQKQLEEDPGYQAFMEVRDVFDEQALAWMLKQKYNATDYDADRFGKKINNILKKLKQKDEQYDFENNSKNNNSSFSPDGLSSNETGKRTKQVVLDPISGLPRRNIFS